MTNSTFSSPRRCSESIGGGHTTSFTDSLEAFHWCSDNPFDLLIIDYLMPVLNGIDGIARLRANRSTQKDRPDHFRSRA